MSYALADNIAWWRMLQKPLEDPMLCSITLMKFKHRGVKKLALAFSKGGICITPIENRCLKLSDGLIEYCHLSKSPLAKAMQYRDSLQLAPSFFFRFTILSIATSRFTFTYTARIFSYPGYLVLQNLSSSYIYFFPLSLRLTKQFTLPY